MVPTTVAPRAARLRRGNAASEYDRTGYLVIPAALPPETLAEARAETTAICRGQRGRFDGLIPGAPSAAGAESDPSAAGAELSPGAAGAQADPGAAGAGLGTAGSDGEVLRRYLCIHFRTRSRRCCAASPCCRRRSGCSPRSSGRT